MSEPADASHWNPGRYLQFGDHRLRPAVELLQRVPLTSPRRVVDLGCGTGNVTRLLAARWPAAQVIGIDHSREMLDQACADASGIAWREADIAAWVPDETPDLIFSNAALHWLVDHDRLLPRLLDLLADRGCLALQMPRSWDLPSHRLMREVLAELGGPSSLQRQLARDPVLDAARYHEILADRAGEVDIWETEYLQELSGDDAVLEWVSGAGLRPVMAALDGDAWHQFVAVYRARLRLAYPRDESGCTLYPFRRLFLVARR